jgi:hypothetical protein
MDGRIVNVHDHFRSRGMVIYINHRVNLIEYERDRLEKRKDESLMMMRRQN